MSLGQVVAFLKSVKEKYITIIFVIKRLKG